MKSKLDRIARKCLASFQGSEKVVNLLASVYMERDIGPEIIYVMKSKTNLTEINRLTA